MANNYTWASFEVPTKRPDEVRACLDHITDFVNGYRDDQPAVLHGTVFAAAVQAQRDDLGYVSGAYEVTNDAVWFSHDESIDMEWAVTLAQIVLFMNDDHRTYTAEWADTCSKPRLGEFSGGAVAFNRFASKWKTTADMARELAQSLEKKYGSHS